MKRRVFISLLESKLFLCSSIKVRDYDEEEYEYGQREDPWEDEDLN